MGATNCDVAFLQGGDWIAIKKATLVRSAAATRRGCRLECPPLWDSIAG